MAGIHDPLKVNLGVADYLRNAYQVGAHRESKEKAPDERENADKIELTSARGTKAAFQNGIAQNNAKKNTTGNKCDESPQSKSSNKTLQSPALKPQSPDVNLPGPVAPPSDGRQDSLSQKLTMAQIAQNDALNANETLWQMAAERQKHSWKLMELIQDMQNEVIKTITDIAAKRDKVLTEIATQWAAVLGGYELK
ncbi:MAG: hypothetical protein RDV48_00485 [Candidatus Eremiobacteraeota bacterium]|nr:hypothetical protein [Candidatus Eremiobacteraeota bacterium]